jgi:hypothetical protein
VEKEKGNNTNTRKTTLRLARDMNIFMRQQTDEAGNHMRPQRNNSGRDIRERFPRESLLDALKRFYQQNRDKYPDAARDFFKQHPELGVELGC